MINLRRFDKGLWLTPSVDETPVGGLRRMRGVSGLSRQTLKSRHGSGLVYNVEAHSAVRFGDVWHAGVGTTFTRRGMGSIKSGLDGERLATVSLPPIPGKADYLMVCGGGDSFKVSASGGVTKWGIDAPADGMTGAKNTQLAKVISSFDTHTDWTGTNATVADETTNVVDGSATKVTVASNTAGKIVDNNTIDLTAFTGGAVSGDEDYIEFYIRIDEPSRIEFIQLDFSLNSTNFGGEVYSRKVIMGRLSEKPLKKGTGSAPELSEENAERVWVANNSQTRDEFDQGINKGKWKWVEKENPIQAATESTVVEKTANVWQKMQLSKKLFKKEGGETYDWSDVQSVRFQIKTNNTGEVVVWLDHMRLIGGFGLHGDYKYRVTYRNTTTGAESDPNATAVEVTGVERHSVALTSIPVSSDGQVDQRRIWRTLGDGTLYFICGTVDDNTTTTFTDEVADFYFLDSRSGASALGATEMSFDNLEPYTWFEDCAGPYNAAVFWGTRTESGEKGRLYYSRIGYTENVKGFIEVTSDDDPFQRVVVWNASLYFISESRFFQITGKEPYIPREIVGAPGTDAPRTVVETPYGIAYKAHDGPRIFNGAQSVLLGGGALEVIFRGESKENLSAFEGTEATYARGEYIISDGSQTIAYHFEKQTWRDLGVAVTALEYAKDGDVIAATIGGKLLELEKEGEVSDYGTAIAYAVEPWHERLGVEKEGLVQHVHVDADTGGAVLTVTMILDGDETVLGTVQTDARKVTSFNVGIFGRVVGVRVEGSLSVGVEVFGIDVDEYITEKGGGRG